MAAPPDLKPVYLLTGSDRPKIETALGRLRAPLRARGRGARLGARRCRARTPPRSATSGSLFGDARLVVVEGVDGRRNAEGRLANGWKVADVKAVEAYLASPAPGTVLALVAEELKKDAPLAKACAKAGEVLAYEVAKRNVNQWVADRFRQAGARAEPEACAALIHLVGEDFHQLANEIDKLALWAGDEPIGERRGRAARRCGRGDTRRSRSPTPGRSATPARTLAASETIFEREGRPRRDTAPRLAGALVNHLSFMRRCQQLAAEGVRPRDAAGEPEAAPVLRREGLRAGGELLRGGARATASSGWPGSTMRSRAAASSRPTSSSSER